METQLQILTKKAKPFKGNEGDQIMYFWYDARRGDDVQIQFGSLREYEPGEEIKLSLIKTENSKGRIFYKEIA